MELRHQAALLRRWWWVVLLCSLLLGSLGAWQQLGKPAQYASRVTMYMSSSRAQNVQVSQTNNLAVQQLASYAKVVGTGKLAHELVKDAKLDVSTTQLAKGMTARLNKDTVLMTVTTTLPSEAQARAASEQLPKTLTRVARELGGEMAEDEFEVTFTTIDGPAISQTRSTPKLLVAVLVGLLLGAALGAAIASLLGRLMRGLRSPEELRDLAVLPVLGILPRTAGRAAPRTDRDRWNALLRLARHIANPRMSRKIIAVTGVDENTRAVATGLASALADTGERVLLLTPDLAGDSETPAQRLSGTRPVESSTEPGLFRLPSAATPSTPQQWREWRENAPVDEFDRIIIETEPVLGGQDTSAQLNADTTVLVASQFRTERDAIPVARQALTAAGVDDVVAVMDNVDPRMVPRHEVLGGVALLDAPPRPTRASA